MQKKLTETETKFIDFLQVVNLIKDATLVDPRPRRTGFQGFAWDAAIEQRNEVWRKLLTEAVSCPFETERDRELFCRFLFRKPSIDKIEDSVSSFDWEEDEIRLASAASIYYSFYLDLKVFRELMAVFEANPAKETLKWSTTMALPDRPTELRYDSERNIEYGVQQNSLFYGFRDFKRVRRCPVCTNYFLAMRTDAKFCSEECGTQSRQATFHRNRSKDHA